MIAGCRSNAELARPYFAEAIELARAVGGWRLSQILTSQATTAAIAGDPIAQHAPAEEGRDLADAIGDRFTSRRCRWCLGTAQTWQGDLVGAAAQFAELVAEAKAAHDVRLEAQSLASQGSVLAYQGDIGAARPAATRPSRPPPSWVGSSQASVTQRWLPRPWPPAILRRPWTRPSRPGHT